ncbi:MAG: TIR domain-containing protein [Bacteroidota bacterium]
MNLVKSIVKVLNRAHQIRGAGFIVADSYIITASHAIKAINEDFSEHIDIEYAYNNLLTKAKVEHIDSDLNIAVLIPDTIPDGVVPLELGESQNSQFQYFQSFGFTGTDRGFGIFTHGQVTGILDSSEDKDKFLQLKSENITVGFSGAPILNRKTNKVIGFVHAILKKDNYGRNTDVAFAIPSEIISKSFPKIKISRSTDKNIFISYSTKNSRVANDIDQELLAYGYDLLKDTREINYKDSIWEYIKKVRNVDFVLLILSNDFLQSPYCMFEVLEFLKDENYKERVLPVFLDDIKIFNPVEALKYVSYWEEKYSEFSSQLKLLDPVNVAPFYQDLKMYGSIKSTISEFLVYIRGTKLVGYEDLKSREFLPLFNEIEK